MCKTTKRLILTLTIIPSMNYSNVVFESDHEKQDVFDDYGFSSVFSISVCIPDRIVDWKFRRESREGH